MEKQEKAITELFLKYDSDTIVRLILSSTKSTPSQSIEHIKTVRTEMGLKMQDVMNKIISFSDAFVVGQQWKAKQDFKRYKTDRIATVTHVTETGAVFDDGLELDRAQILEHFEKIPIKSKR